MENIRGPDSSTVNDPSTQLTLSEAATPLSDPGSARWVEAVAGGPAASGRGSSAQG